MEEKLSRRQLLKHSAAATVSLSVLSAAGASLGGCQSEKKSKIPLITHGIINIGPASNYPAGKVSNQFLAQYNIAISNDGGTVTAIQPVCTHMGCLAPWDAESNHFVCPCHGSKFDIQGLVFHGPAKTALPRVATIPNPDGTLSVNLDQLPQPVKKD